MKPSLCSWRFSCRRAAQTVKRRLPHFSRGFAAPSPARSPKNTRRQLCGEMISLAIWLTYKVF